jgi:hypothetical protein
MKRSTMVTLVLSGALSGTLLTGCADPQEQAEEEWQGQQLTNNTYRAGSGYWHAPYRGWYPYPYNCYRPGYGYYHGGEYSSSPHSSPITVSSPVPGHARAASAHASGVSRGGFGSSAHSVGT